MKETLVHADAEEYSNAYEYSPVDPHSTTIRSLHVDASGSAWLEAGDGQRVSIPQEIRGLIAKRVREARM